MKDDNKRTGEKQNVKSKIKSAIYRKVNKNAQSDKSAQCDGNKQIADFIFAKERSDFRKRKCGAGTFYPIMAGFAGKRRSQASPYKTDICLES
jgi:hypothetical protein